MGGCTSSEEETEEREGREETHVGGGWRECGLRTQRYMKGRGYVGEDGTPRKGWRVSYTLSQVI